MSMFTLSRTVLLMHMRTRHKMRNTHSLKKVVKVLVLVSPIRLHSKNFLVKETLNMLLNITKFLKHIRFFFQKIYPGELAKIINEAHIIFKSTKRFWGRAPYIGEYKLKRRSRHTSCLWIWKLMALGHLTSITNCLFIGQTKQNTITTKNLMKHNR
jgi:hypothetical protein